jgi:hypothetical protein
VRVSLLGIEILTIDARIVIASVDTYLRFAEAVNRLDLREAGDSQGPPEPLESPRAARSPRARARSKASRRSLASATMTTTRTATRRNRSAARVDGVREPDASHQGRR